MWKRDSRPWKSLHLTSFNNGCANKASNRNTAWCWLFSPCFCWISSLQQQQQPVREMSYKVKSCLCAHKPQKWAEFGRITTRLWPTATWSLTWHNSNDLICWANRIQISGKLSACEERKSEQWHPNAGLSLLGVIFQCLGSFCVTLPLGQM